MKNLTDLPNELILMIFKHLEYDDLMVLKRLNKEWSSLVIRCIEAKIVVIVGNGEFSYESFDDKLYLIGRSSIAFRNNSDLHLWIKKLVLHFPVFIFDLIGFDNLIDLEIYLGKIASKHSGRLFLRIKNLKYLIFIQHVYLEDLKVCLDAPKLTNLDVRMDNLDLFKIIHPLSIKYLVTEDFNETINQMNNLEELILDELKIDEIGDLFNRLKRLKKFSFYSFQNGLNSIHQFIQSILLLNPTLKISYQCIELNNDLNLLQLDGFDSDTLTNESVQIYMNHLDKISNLTHTHLDISNLDLISAELIQKSTNLETLIIDEITDQEKWIQLLSLPELVSIQINSFVDQEFLNLIPKYCKLLTHLFIEQFEAVKWLLKLKYLEHLEINYQLDFEMFKKLINNLNYLKMIRTNQHDEEESYEIEINHSNVECKFNKKIILTYSRTLFLKTIESCSFWGDLF